MKSVKDRFIEYVKVDTTSSEESVTHPSTSKQFDLARKLYGEMQSIGLTEITFDEEYCYLYASLPSNLEDGRQAPVLGFIAHMDTSSAVSGTDVKPQVIENYDGNDLVLNKEKDIVLSTKSYPELKGYAGKTLIVTDGTTLLGADDKAGVAEIMTAMEYLQDHPEIKHGKIRIAFTPDEEIGAGVDFFKTDVMKADFAYTVDGGSVGELEYENFNAASAEVVIKGISIHPGEAKNKMVNALLLGTEFVQMIPRAQTPEHTEGYEGFFHLMHVVGDIEKTTLQYIIRDHDKAKFQQKKAFMESCANFMNHKYGEGMVEVTIKDSYYNMKEMIEPNMHLIDNAKKAYEACGVTPRIVPIRGGTDGCRLSYMGLPCPNMFTGGHNFHGRYEYICLESMESMVQIIAKLAEIYGNFIKEIACNPE